LWPIPTSTSFIARQAQNNNMPDPAGTIQAAVWRAMRLDTKGAQEVVYALTWFIKQQPKILNRFDPDQNDRHTREGLGEAAYWPMKLQMYLHRARLLSLDSPQGRQAVAEYAATSIGLLASVWRVYGPPDSAKQSFASGIYGHDATRKIE
jgi:hypothetical protein